MSIILGISVSIIIFNIGVVASMCRLQTKCEERENKLCNKIS